MLGVGKQRPYAKCGQNIPAPFPAAAYGKAPLRQRKRRCELITTLGRNNAWRPRAGATPSGEVYATPAGVGSMRWSGSGAAPASVSAL